MDSTENAPELRAIDGDLTREGLTGILESHRNALQDVRGDTQRLHERIERMVPELQTALKDAKSAERTEVIPTGDNAVQDTRYLLSDGSVQFDRSTIEVPLPDGSTHKIERHGLLTDPNPSTPEQKRAQDAYASYALAHLRATTSNRAPFADALTRAAYLNFRGSLQDLGGNVGRYCRSLFSDPELMKRAVTSTSGAGGELIANPTISNIRRPSDLSRRVPGLVKTVEVSSSTFKRASVTGRGLAAARAVTTDSPSAYTPRTFTTADGSLTVKDMEITALIDPLWVADAGMVLGDPMGFVLEWLEAGYADSLEMAFLHGDTAGTHMDTDIANWTLGGLYSAGDLSGASAPTKFWIGFRGRAVDDSATASGGGTWDASDHFGGLNLMSNLAGSGVVAITGLDCLYTQLLASSTFTTVDQMGSAATLVTGEIGSIGGVPIILSEMMTKEFDSSSGLVTGSNLSNAIVFANVDRYTHYVHSGGAAEFDVTYPEKGAQYVGMVRRSLLDFDGVSGEKPCALVYNL